MQQTWPNSTNYLNAVKFEGTKCYGTMSSMNLYIQQN